MNLTLPICHKTLNWNISIDGAKWCILVKEGSVYVIGLHFIRQLPLTRVLFHFYAVCIEFWILLISDRLQRVNIKLTLWDKQELSIGVPHESILGPIMFWFDIKTCTWHHSTFNWLITTSFICCWYTALYCNSKELFVSDKFSAMMTRQNWPFSPLIRLTEWMFRLVVHQWVIENKIFWGNI